MVDFVGLAGYLSRKGLVIVARPSYKYSNWDINSSQVHNLTLATSGATGESP